jgi:hypothetical protein
METSSLTLHGDAAERVPETLVEETATVGARSINKLGVDNVHRYRGDGMTLLAYEQSAAYREAWVMVAILFEPVDETTSRAVVLVGGGARRRWARGTVPDQEPRTAARSLGLTDGPAGENRWLVGEEADGETGRLGSVVERIEDVCETLDVALELE